MAPGTARLHCHDFGFCKVINLGFGSRERTVDNSMPAVAASVTWDQWVGKETLAEVCTVIHVFLRGIYGTNI